MSSGAALFQVILCVYVQGAWPHYRGNFVRYRCVQDGHVSGVIL